MDLVLTDEQEQLATAARAILEREAGSAACRAASSSADGIDRAQWAVVTDAGWTSMGFPDSNGGNVAGLVELCVVLEEAGRSLLAAPLLTTVGVAAAVVLEAEESAARARVFDAIARENAIVSLAVVATEGMWEADGLTGVSAIRSGDSWELSGRRLHVPHPDAAQLFVVAARSDEGVILLIVPSDALADRPVALRTLDRTRPMGTICLDGVRLGSDHVLAGPQSGSAVLRRGLDRAAIAVAAEAIGVGTSAIRLAVDYAKTRMAFGHLIGTFQGVSHRLADAYAAVETARSLVQFAAWAVDVAEPGRSAAAASAKSAACAAARDASATAIQTHGGMGFTWEHDVHLYYRRAKWLEFYLGSVDTWMERVLDVT
jgi:alkylation response protein AidB-like acyl-CoA dehydrogenase